MELSISKLNGEHIQCLRCAASGLVLDIHGEPDECSQCGGSGLIWRYNGGAIARYYSGPLIGRVPPCAE
jgi:hypothetical protein